MRHSAGVSDFRQITAVDCHISTPETNKPEVTCISDDTNTSLSKESPPSCVLLSCVTCGAPLSQQQVRVHYDPSLFRRRTNRSHEAAIHSRWRRLLRQNPRLYNGSKFRIAAVSLDRATNSDQCCRFVCLSLGLTCYRDHMGTNCCEAAARLLQEAGITIHGNSQAFLADCLGVGALLLTADNRFVFVRRAGWTGEYPSRLDRPGGHAEPDYLLKRLPSQPVADCSGGVRDDSWLEILQKERLPEELVCHEVFDSVRREVSDELGISGTHLSRPLLLALARDSNCAGRPTLEFIIRCSLPSTEVLRVYREGKHSEADESVGLVFLHLDDVTSCHSVEQLNRENPITIHQLDEVSDDVSSAANGHISSVIETTANEDISDRVNGEEMESDPDSELLPAINQSDCCPTEENTDGAELVCTTTPCNSVRTSTTATSSPCSVVDARDQAAVDEEVTENGRGGGPGATIREVVESGSTEDSSLSVVQKPTLSGVWNDMTPACKASVCLLQRFNLSQLTFNF